MASGKRASAIPPPSAKKNCSDGTARLARNETVATWASPVCTVAEGEGEERAPCLAGETGDTAPIVTGRQENARPTRIGGRWLSHPTRGVSP